jgi:hypothetical protein
MFTDQLARNSMLEQFHCQEDRFIDINKRWQEEHLSHDFDLFIKLYFINIITAVTKFN